MGLRIPLLVCIFLYFVYLYIIYILFSSLRKQQANFLRMKTQAGEPGGLVGPNLLV
jgi:hypothetical protein